MALLIGTAALVWSVANIYPDQIFSAYLETRRWVAAAGPIQKLPTPTPIPSDPMPLSKEESSTRFVLLPAKAAKWIAKSGTWQPTKMDIDGLEASLRQVSSLRAENWPANMPIAIDHPEQYFRQYIAVIRKGRKLIYINAFCHDFPVSCWRQQLVLINDGGSCCWQALYDPVKSEFSALRINGVA
jgi:hypothetical protein